MIPKALSKITIEDIDFLISTPVVESKTIEYKSELTLTDDKSKLKFVKGISSFANSSGGDFIVGLEAIDGIPRAIKGISDSDVDQMVIKMDQIIKSGIEPRPHCEIQPIKVGSGKSIIIIRVSKSWQPPHMVTLNSHNQFYGRSSANKYPLDVHEIRSTILNSFELTEKIRKFQLERIFKIKSNETPHPISSTGKIVIHLIPINFLSKGISIDYDKCLLSADNMLGPYGGGGFDWAINLDGVCFSFQNRERTKASRYTQVFRSGAIEIVADASSREDYRTLPSSSYEINTVKLLRDYQKRFHLYGIDFPVYVFLSFVNFKGYELGLGNPIYESPVPCAQDVVTIPNVEWNNEKESVPSVMKPIFDSVWNLFGLPKSSNYDDSGKWKHSN